MTEFELKMQEYLKKCEALNVDPETSDHLYARAYRANRECAAVGLTIISVKEVS